MRRHVPSTLSRIPCQASMDVLIAALVNEKDAFLRYKCVAAIDRLHGEHPELTFDPSPIETLAWLEGMQFYQFLSYHDNLFTRGGVTTPCLLKSLLEEKRARARERVFFMLALLYPRRDVMAARWELEHGDARAKASACEYLDNVLSGPLRRQLMPMLEELTDEERVTKGNVILRTRPRDVEETLLILINSDDEVVSAAAIDLVGRLELRSLVDDLDHVLAPPRRARLARLRGGVVDAGRPAPAGLEAARAVARAAAQRRDRQPPAGDPPLRLGRDRRAVPDRAHRPAGPARSRPHALRSRRAAVARPPPARRPGAGHRARRRGARRAAPGAARPRGGARGAPAPRDGARHRDVGGAAADGRGSARPARRQHRPGAGAVPLDARSPGVRRRPPGRARHRRRIGRRGGPRLDPTTPAECAARRCGRSTSSWRCGAFRCSRAARSKRGWRWRRSRAKSGWSRTASCCTPPTRRRSAW